VDQGKGSMEERVKGSAYVWQRKELQTFVNVQVLGMIFQVRVVNVSLSIVLHTVYTLTGT